MWNVYEENADYGSSPGYVMTKTAEPFGANITYGDGHTDWVPLSKLKQIGPTANTWLWSTEP